MSDIRSRLASIVGEEHVTENPGFTSRKIGHQPSIAPLVPSFTVKPSNTKEVQLLVKLANEELLPLVPVSSSPPHRTGGTYPEAPGAIIVDLSGMNRILKINRRHHLAIIEPGVTWAQLSQALKKEGLRIPQPLQPKEGKSVIATLLEREPLLSPKYQWNVNEPLRSMEIVFGSGDIIRSGMGGHRGERDEDWDNGTIPVTNAGPHQFDFMKMVTGAQGSIGIVTWASVKLETATKEEQALLVEGQSIEALSGFLYKTLKFRFGDEVCVFNRPALASLLADTPAEFTSYQARLALWTTLVNVKWGALRAKEKIKVQVADIGDIAQEQGLVPVRTIAGLPGKVVADKILVDSSADDWKAKATGAYDEIFFLTTLDRLPSQLEAAAGVAQAHAYDFDACPVYIQPLHQGVNIHCHIVLPRLETAISSVEFGNLCATMSEELMRHGAFFSRPYGNWAGMVYAPDSQHTALTKKMKDIFDPKHILNPGKLCFHAAVKGE